MSQDFFTECFVGSMPPAVGEPIDAQKMQRSGSVRPLNYTGGEVRRSEHDWVAVTCRQIARALKVPTAALLTGTNYLHYPVRLGAGAIASPLVSYRINHGYLPPLRYADWAIQDFETFERLEREAGKPSGAQFWRSTGTPKAYQTFSGVVGHLDAFEDLMIVANKKILDKHPEVALQFDMPTELAMGQVRYTEYDDLYNFYVGSLKPAGRVIRATPVGTGFVFHATCEGDLGGKPLLPAWRRSPVADVAMINAISAMPEWQEGWNLLAVHDSFGNGKQLPQIAVSTVKLYEDLLQPPPEGTVFGMGIVQPDISVRQIEALAKDFRPMLERKGVTRGAIGNFCGMGRETLAEAKLCIGNMQAAVYELNS